MQKKIFLFALVLAGFGLGVLYSRDTRRFDTLSETSKTTSDKPSAESSASEDVTNEPKEEVETPAVSSSRKLDLSGQGLNKLPESVLNQKDLEELNISDNNLEGALPAEIRHLSNLKVLLAGDNNMTGVPAEIGQLSKLEILDLSNNELTGLPNELGNLKNLRLLILTGNDYSEHDLDIIKNSLRSDVEIRL